MDWLVGRQDAIEAELACRHLSPQANLAWMALSSLSSSWVEGRRSIKKLMAVDSPLQLSLSSGTSGTSRPMTWTYGRCSGFPPAAWSAYLERARGTDPGPA